MNMLKNRLKQKDCKNGFVLDGFPRTIKQAELLKEVTEIDHFLNLDIPNQVIMDRMTSRRTCKGCGSIFNVKIMHESGFCKSGGCCQCVYSLIIKNV